MNGSFNYDEMINAFNELFDGKIKTIEDEINRYNAELEVISNIEGRQADVSVISSFLERNNLYDDTIKSFIDIYEALGHDAESSQFERFMTYVVDFVQNVKAKYTETISMLNSDKEDLVSFKSFDNQKELVEKLEESDKFTDSEKVLIISYYTYSNITGQSINLEEEIREEQSDNDSIDLPSDTDELREVHQVDNNSIVLPRNIDELKKMYEADKGYIDHVFQKKHNTLFDDFYNALIIFNKSGSTDEEKELIRICKEKAYSLRISYLDIDYENNEVIRAFEKGDLDAIILHYENLKKDLEKHSDIFEEFKNIYRNFSDKFGKITENSVSEINNENNNVEDTSVNAEEPSMEVEDTSVDAEEPIEQQDSAEIENVVNDEEIPTQQENVQDITSDDILDVSENTEEVPSKPLTSLIDANVVHPNQSVVKITKARKSLSERLKSRFKHEHSYYDEFIDKLDLIRQIIANYESLDESEKDGSLSGWLESLKAFEELEVSDVVNENEYNNIVNAINSFREIAKIKGIEEKLFTSDDLEDAQISENILFDSKNLVIFLDNESTESICFEDDLEEISGNRSEYDKALKEAKGLIKKLLQVKISDIGRKYNAVKPIEACDNWNRVRAGDTRVSVREVPVDSSVLEKIKETNNLDGTFERVYLIGGIFFKRDSMTDNQLRPLVRELNANDGNIRKILELFSNPNADIDEVNKYIRQSLSVLENLRNKSNERGQ